jgi:hypothetical protein
MKTIKLRYYFIYLLIFVVCQSQNNTSNVHLINKVSEDCSNLPQKLDEIPPSGYYQKF